MALQVTKNIIGIEVTTYALITKFWHTKFEVVSKPTGEVEDVIDRVTKEPTTQNVYTEVQTVYAQIEYFKDKTYAHDSKASTIKDIFTLIDFDPNLEMSVNQQIYNLLKQQVADFKDAIDV